MSHGLSVAKNVRARITSRVSKLADLSNIDPKQVRQRDRWRRNKRAARARKSRAPQVSIPTEIQHFIWAERERRYADYPGHLWNVHGWQSGRGSWDFLCDVWAVRTLLELQLGPTKITAGKVARWMWENDLRHGYKAESLRTMVYRAYAAIAVLETIGGRRGQSPHWSRSTQTGELVAPL